MARRYGTEGETTVTSGASSAKSVMGLVSATTVRPRLYDLVIGSGDSPADNATKFQIKRFTAVGSATTVTPQALDPNDPAALASCRDAYTGEPTYTSGALLHAISMNQRNTFRWVCAPGGEIVCPATANNGVAVFSSGSTAAIAYQAVLFHEE